MPEDDSDPADLSNVLQSNNRDFLGGIIKLALSKMRLLKSIFNYDRVRDCLLLLRRVLNFSIRSATFVNRFLPEPTIAYDRLRLFSQKFAKKTKKPAELPAIFEYSTEDGLDEETRATNDVRVRVHLPSVFTQRPLVDQKRNVSRYVPGNPVEIDYATVRNPPDDAINEFYLKQGNLFRRRRRSLTNANIFVDQDVLDANFFNDSVCLDKLTNDIRKLRKRHSGDVIATLLKIYVGDFLLKHQELPDIESTWTRY